MTQERLIHYSRFPLSRMVSVPLDQQESHFKPRGLWVSVEGPDDWKDWCISESSCLEAFTNAHQVILSDSANILRISDAEGIDDLTREYSLSRCGMQWKTIAERYDGIIIAPYIWSRRLSLGTSWYYSWDCASGCLWNAAAVSQIVPLDSAVSAEVPA